MARTDRTSSSRENGVARDPQARPRLVDEAGTAAAEVSDPVSRSKPAPGLYVVATPIGNLGDVTLRALETLKAVDAIACEDSRVTVRLLQRYGIAAPLLPYHEHNAAAMRPKFLAMIAGGAAIALVSDAGTPLVSDPGYKLVRAMHDAGHRVTVLPGPSAALAALVLAGLPTDRFLFAGFLPPKTSARRRALAELAEVKASLIFFESARRLPDMLVDLAAELGPREAAIVREVTKIYEEVVRAPLDTLAARYRTSGAPKGEVTIVVAPPDAPAAMALDDAAVDDRLRTALATMSASRAAAAVAAATGLERRALYRRAIALKPSPPDS